MADLAGVDTTASADAYERDLSIDDVEAGIVADLDGVTLVGEIDLDHWGELAEAMLRPTLDRHEVSRVERLWPATLVTYLVHQGIHAYEESTYWSNVSIPGLREGQLVGPKFIAALKRLHLDTFEDLERFEGIGKHTRGMYIRRIHLHGGLPRNAVGEVLELLAATLRAGAASAQEVVSQWSSRDLSHHVRSRAAVRLFTYTGDFGVHLVEQLVELLRIANRRGDLHLEGVPSHLIDGVMAFAEQDHRRSAAFDFVPGPRVALSLGAGPVLEVPKSGHKQWSVDGQRLGNSSRQVEQAFLLPPPAAGEWSVTAVDGFTTTPYRFVSVNGRDPIFVFDERRRLHYRTTTLGGVVAYVLAPVGMVVSGAVDRRTAGDDWPGHEVITCDLRRRDTLQIEPESGGEAIKLVVDSRLDVRLAGDVVDGLTTAAGEPVLSYYARLAFGGHAPDPADVTVSIDGRELPLTRFEEIDGEFDITSELPDTGSSRVHLAVSRDGVEPVHLDFAHFPGLRVNRPSFVRPHTDVEVILSSRAQGTLVRKDLRFRDNETMQRTMVRSGAVEYELDVSINRLLWSRSGPDVVTPMFDADPLLLSVKELRLSDLHLRSGGVPLTVSLRDADASHEVRPRVDRQGPGVGRVPLRSFAEHVRAGGVSLNDSPLGTEVSHEARPRVDRHRPGVVSLPLRAFAETATAAAAARTHLVVCTPDDPEPIEIGIIESRYEPWAIETDQLSIGREESIDVRWTELREWPDRVVRVWHPTEPQPILVHPVEAGATTASLTLPSVEPGWYLIEVTTKGGWGSPRRPAVGPGCVRLHLGSNDAKRLYTAILTGDRRERFDDEALNELVPVMADLMVKLAPGDLAPEVLSTVAPPAGGSVGDTAASARLARVALYERIADDHWRAIDVLDDLADQFVVGFNGEGREAMEPMLIELLPLLFDYPIRAADDRQADRLEHLWLVAPLAAACLDAARTDPRCHERWIAATGVSTKVKDSVTTSLDRLADRVPRSTPTPLAVSPLLGSGSWGAAIRSVAGALTSRAGLDLAHTCEQLATDLWRKRNGEYPHWSSTAQRLQRHLQSHEREQELLTALGVLALAHLDCESPRRSDDVVEALHQTYALLPEATRTTLLYAAACLRVLEDAGALARLET